MIEDELTRLLRDKNLVSQIDRRVREFKEIGRASKEKIFSELSFCILTANYRADRSILIQEEVGNGFLTLPEDRLAEVLRSLGHRFPNTRARYIVSARDRLDDIVDLLCCGRQDSELREWLVRNVKGLGYKEASHFLRNTGHLDVAIIDFHIVDLLYREGVITEKPKRLGKREYLNTERQLVHLGERFGLRLGELDLYLWYLETGKVLK